MLCPQPRGGGNETARLHQGNCRFSSGSFAARGTRAAAGDACDRVLERAPGEYDRLPAFAAEFVQRRVNVLVATGGPPSAVAAKQATSTIPIVFVAGDPVKDGLVASLNRPGGNATGSFISTSEPEMEQKRLSLLHELTPGVPLIGALLNPNYPDAARQLPALEEAARIIGDRK